MLQIASFRKDAHHKQIEVYDVVSDLPRLVSLIQFDFCWIKKMPSTTQSSSDARIFRILHL